MPAKTVSILRETRPGERRIILLPDQIRQFRDAGFVVFVEAGAGEGVGYGDDAYRRAGAELVDPGDGWLASDFVLKYKVPYRHEYSRFRPGLHLGAWFHAEGNPELTGVLRDSGVIAYSYEFFRTPDGVYPMSMVSSEISGKLAVVYGAYHLQSHLGGSGVLLADVVGVAPPKVVVIGYGNAGGAAARLAVKLGAQVTVFGTNAARLRQFQATVPSSIRCLVATRDELLAELRGADLVVGALRISTYDTPPLIDEDMVRQMKRGSVIVDVTCGYGSGYLPTADRLATPAEPVYERFGVLHCKLDMMPAGVPVTTNHAVSPLVAPYLVNLGRSIYEEGFEDPTSAAGKIVDRGQLVHPEVIRHMLFHDSAVHQQ